MSFCGMDPDVAQTKATTMFTQAKAMEELVRKLDAELRRLQWSGEDARRFIADWDSSFKVDLNNGMKTLTDFAASVTSAAKRQDRASCG